MQEHKTSMIQETRPPEEKRRQPGGRRISDRIKPLLSQLLSVIASDNIHEGFFNLTDEITDSFDCQSLVIYSTNEDRTQLVSRNFISEEIGEKRVEIAPSNLPGYVFTSGQALNINDAYDKNDLARFPGLSHDPWWDEITNIKTQTVLVLPVVHGEETIGVLEIINKRDQTAFSEQYLKLARNFSVHLGKALFKLEQEENREKRFKTSLAIQKAAASPACSNEIEQSPLSEQDNNVIRWVNKTISNAYEQKVAEIHIELDNSELVVRYRKDGESEVVDKVPDPYKSLFISRIKTQAGLGTSRLPQEGEIKIKYGQEVIELQVTALPTVDGNEDVVMRILGANPLLSLDSLNFSKRD